MNQSKVGFRSRLKYVVDDLEMKLGRGVPDRVIAERSGISRVTLSTWMKPYMVIERLDFGVLQAVIHAVEEIAADEGVKIILTPKDLIEFVGFADSPNKIEGLPVGLAF